MKELQLLKSAWDYRRNFVRREKLEAFRLVHGKGDGASGLFIDFYQGSFLIVIREARWAVDREKLIRALQSLSSDILPLSTPHFFWVMNFPSSPSSLKPGPIQTKWVCEKDLAFEIHLGEGLHTGLFLDQRENRRFLHGEVRGKRVLNLFSYTGAFTVAALKGGAREVVSVDLSKNYLTWLKRNLEHNNLEAARAPTAAMDVFEYLKKAEKKNEKFDLIILDPPTFSRAKKSFSTEKNLVELVSQTAGLLAPKAHLFVSVNTARLNPSQFRSQIIEAVSPFGLKIVKTFSVPPDFRPSPEEKKNPHLKSAWVGR